MNHSAAELIPDIREGNPDRVFLVEWHNGASIQVLYHKEPQPGEHPCDRIRLLCTSKDGNQRGWLMNDQDADAIIMGLTSALGEYRRDKGTLVSLGTTWTWVGSYDS